MSDDGGRYGQVLEARRRLDSSGRPRVVVRVVFARRRWLVQRRLLRVAARRMVDEAVDGEGLRNGGRGGRVGERRRRRLLGGNALRLLRRLFVVAPRSWFVELTVVRYH